ncbi:MAG: hypothetical protein PF572_00585 [Patescibacteria group bacterium]|jgi:3D (Asp-Asp-Asp) domain-containing protein|nr:hypothetical protein [Patescibacteria group bacterium]
MSRLQSSHIKLISVGLAKKISIIVWAIFVFDTLLFPSPMLAKYSVYNVNVTTKNNTNQNFLPDNKDREYSVKYTKYTTITAYNSLVGQTDNTPCITANGFDVCEHGIEDTIAANFLRFGTKVKIPDLFGDRIFIVRDRMNSRYTNRVDVWLLERSDAITLGKRLAKIEVLE